MHVELAEHIQHMRMNSSFGNNQRGGDGFICGVSVQYHLLQNVPFSVC